MVLYYNVNIASINLHLVMESSKIKRGSYKFDLKNKSPLITDLFKTVQRQFPVHAVKDTGDRNYYELGEGNEKNYVATKIEKSFFKYGSIEKFYEYVKYNTKKAYNEGEIEKVAKEFADIVDDLIDISLTQIDLTTLSLEVSNFLDDLDKVIHYLYDTVGSIFIDNDFSKYDLKNAIKNNKIPQNFSEDESKIFKSFLKLINVLLSNMSKSDKLTPSQEYISSYLLGFIESYNNSKLDIGSVNYQSGNALMKRAYLALQGRFVYDALDLPENACIIFDSSKDQSQILIGTNNISQCCFVVAKFKSGKCFAMHIANKTEQSDIVNILLENFSDDRSDMTVSIVMGNSFHTDENKKMIAVENGQKAIDALNKFFSTMNSKFGELKMELWSLDAFNKPHYLQNSVVWDPKTFRIEENVVAVENLKEKFVMQDSSARMKLYDGDKPLVVQINNDFVDVKYDRHLVESDDYIIDLFSSGEYKKMIKFNIEEGDLPLSQHGQIAFYLIALCDELIMDNKELRNDYIAGRIKYSIDKFEEGGQSALWERLSELQKWIDKRLTDEKDKIQYPRKWINNIIKQYVENPNKDFNSFNTKLNLSGYIECISVTDQLAKNSPLYNHSMKK